MSDGTQAQLGSYKCPKVYQLEVSDSTTLTCRDFIFSHEPLERAETVRQGFAGDSLKTHHRAAAA